MPAGRRGRPSADLTPAIYDARVALGEPELEKPVLSRLAEHFYQEEWTNSNGDPRSKKSYAITFVEVSPVPCWRYEIKPEFRSGY